MLACAPDGFEELSCVAGIWRAMQTCRGGGGCKANASGVTCDPGALRQGDACVVASTAPRCADAHTVLLCQNGRFTSSLCLPPAKCQAGAKNGQSGCK